MRPYYVDFEAPQTRRVMAILHFERRARGGSSCPHRRPGGAMSRLREIASLLRLWRQRAHERQQLARLDARMLRDIGITSADAQRECDKPFWRA